MKDMKSMKRKRDLATSLHELNRVSLAEILFAMTEELAVFADCPFLTKSQQGYVDQAQHSLQCAVDVWLHHGKHGKTGKHAVGRMKHGIQVKPEPPLPSPTQAMEPILDMLAVYHDDIDEAHYTPTQVQRITLAMHNLFEVYEELKRNVQ